MEFSKKEIAALEQTLHEAEARWQQLTGRAWTEGATASACEGLAQGDIDANQASILNALPAHVAILDEAGVIIFINERWRLFGHDNGLQRSNSSVGENYLEVCEQAEGIYSEEARETGSRIRALLSTGGGEFSFEYPCHSPSEQRWFRFMVSPMARNKKGAAVVMHVDITKRRLAEEALKESEERFRTSFDQAAVGICYVSTHGHFARVNDKLCDILGYTREELLERTMAQVTLPEDWAPSEQARLAMLAGEASSYSAEKRYRRKNNELVWANLVTTLERTAEGEPKYFLSVIEDITRRKLAEFRLYRLNRLHTVLSKIAEAIVRTPDRPGLYQTGCRVVVDDGLLRMAFIAEVEEPSGRVQLAASYGQGLEHVRELMITTDGGPLSQGTIGTALRTGACDFCNDIAGDPRMEPWRQSALKHGFCAAAAFPLKLGEATIGALVLFASETAYFQEDEVRLMSAVASTLSFALEAQEKEARRQRAEQALLASQQQFASAIEYAAIGMALVALDGRFLKANRALCQMLGYSERELLALTFQDITYLEDLEADLDNVRQLLEGRIEVFQMEKRYLHAQGHLVWALLSVSLARTESGRPIQFVSQIQNITGQRRAQEAIRMQAQMLDHIGQAVISTDLKGVVIYANHFAGELYGWPPKAMLGRDILDVTVPQTTREQAAEILSTLQQGKSWSGEFDVQTLDGRVFPALITDSPLLDEAGRLVGVIGISADISTRKASEKALIESERRFRQISKELAKVLDSSLDVICAFDEEGRFIQASAACEKIWGYRPEELAGTRYLDKVLAEDREITREAAGKIMAGNSTSRFENRYVRKDGSVAWIMWSAWWSEADRSMFCVARDNTETRRAEEDTRQLAERLSDTIESLTDGFFAIDREWRFTYVNAAAERILQHSREELLGSHLWIKFPKARGSQSQIEYERAMRENVAVQFETFYAPLDCWFEVRAYPSAQGLAVYFHDTNEQRKTHEALLLSEERFRLVAKATNDAIWDWNMAEDTVWWSEGMEVLFGFQREEVGPDFEWWTKRIHPEDRARVREQLRDTVNQGQADFADEYRFLRKDGGYAYVLDRGYVIRDGAGQPIRMIGGMTDLSERIDAERQIAEQAALIDQAHDAILVRNLEGRITFWNKGAERLYGWTAGEVANRRLEELLRPGLETFKEATKGLLENGEWSGELQKITKSGAKVIVNCRWTLLRDGRQRPKSYLHIDTDITERKAIEQQFLRAQRMESIGTLAGGIAHDLNNALGPIMMATELLGMRFPDPKSQELISIIATSTRRGAEMVKQVLSFARGVEGQRLQVQAKNLLRDLEKIARDTFLKHIELQTSIPSDLWTILGDPTQIHQVLVNLCVNARDAMPNGGTLKLSAANITLDSHYAALHLGSHAGPYLCFRVEDSGEGMPPEVIEKIFDPFFTTKEIGKGTGLGLSTSLAIVKSHDGFMRVYSEPGNGTKFEVYFPAQTEASPDAASALEEAMPRGHGELILVVDDEPSVREITQQSLEAFGYRVLLASDGAEAVALYARRRAEVAAVLTDMMMPLMDGPSAIQIFRRMNPDLPIIAASGLSTQAHVARVAKLGVTHFLSKPYTAATLLQKLRQVLSKPNQT